MNLSIIVPAYNECEHIANLLKSVFDSLSGFDLTYEIIVVDNGSSDDSAAIAKKYSPNVYSIKRASISFARNAGVAKSSGKVLAFLDADVRITPKWAHEIVKQMDNITENLVLTGSRYVVREKASWIEKSWFDPLSKKTTDYINGGNLIISRRSFDLIGGFDTAFETGEDYKFCVDAKMKGISVLSNPDFVAIHDGFPRNLRAFTRREIWHGKGDYSSFRAFKNSNVAQMAVVFSLYQILLGIDCIFGIFGGFNIYKAMLLVMIPLFMSWKIFRESSFKFILLNVFLCYLYLVSRFFSLFYVVMDRFNKPVKAK